MTIPSFILCNETEETIVENRISVSVVSNFHSNEKKRRTGKFSKSARLLSRAHYKYLQKNSIRLLGEQISVNIGQGKPPSAKLGITVSRKFGKAHERNRFKRVVREAFREIYRLLPEDLQLNVMPRRSDIHLSKQAILVDLQNILSKFIRPEALGNS